MNRIFKLVWNPHVGALVVVSELAPGQHTVGHRHETTGVIPRRLALAIALVSVLGVGTQAGANESQDLQAVIQQFSQPVEDVAMLLAPLIPEKAAQKGSGDGGIARRVESTTQMVAPASLGRTYAATPSDHVGRVLQAIGQTVVEKPEIAVPSLSIRRDGGSLLGEFPRVLAALRPRSPMLSGRFSSLQAQSLPEISLMDDPAGASGILAVSLTGLTAAVDPSTAEVLDAPSLESVSAGALAVVSGGIAAAGQALEQSPSAGNSGSLMSTTTTSLGQRIRDLGNSLDQTRVAGAVGVARGVQNTVQTLQGESSRIVGAALDDQYTPALLPALEVGLGQVTGSLANGLTATLGTLQQDSAVPKNPAYPLAGNPLREGVTGALDGVDALVDGILHGTHVYVLGAGVVNGLSDVLMTLAPNGDALVTELTGAKPFGATVGRTLTTLSDGLQQSGMYLRVGDVPATVDQLTNSIGNTLDVALGGVLVPLGEITASGGLMTGLANTASEATSLISNLDGVITGDTGLFSAVPAMAGRMGVLTSDSPPMGMMSMAPAAVPSVPASTGQSSGLVVSSGGVVGQVTSLLQPTVNNLLNTGDGFVRSGSTAISSANFVQAYSTVNIAGLDVVNLSPVGTLLNGLGGVATGANSHLTVIGGATSDSYIYNINNGDPNGLLGLLLPDKAPDWASQCLDVLGLVGVDCWAINAAQDYQVLIGDGAYANGSKEVVIGTGARHELPMQDAMLVFAGDGVNDPDNPSGLPTADYDARLGHSVVIGDSAVGTANAQVLLGAGATSDKANSVALGYRSAAIRGGMDAYAAYGMSAPQTSIGEVAIGSAGRERQITHVAAGSESTDAVNVGQLQSAISSVVAGVDPLAVRYGTDAGGAIDHTTLLLGAPNTSTQIANVAAGDVMVDSLHAVNGSQLFAQSDNLAVQLGGGAAVAADGSFTGPRYSIGRINTDGSITRQDHTSVGDAFAAIDMSLGHLTTLTANNQGGVVGAVLYDRDVGGTVDSSRVTLGNPGTPTTITNLAAGAVSAISSDAVNGGQLHATQQSVVSLIGGNAMVDPQTAVINDIVFSLNEWTPGGQLQQVMYDNLTDAFDSINRSLTRVTTLPPGTPVDVPVDRANPSSPSPYLSVNSQGDGALATGVEALAVGSEAAAQGSHAVAVGHGATATAANSVALGAGSIASRANSVSVGSENNERQITHVADATAASDAVNLRQLAASEQGSLRYDRGADGVLDYRTVTLGHAESGPVRIRNVAAGVEAADAVNVGQLQSGMAQAMDWSRQYTDDRFSTVARDMKKVGDRASAGVASAMAMAGLPQPYEPGRSMAAVGVSTFNGESGLAVGVSGISEGGRWIYKISGSTNTRGDAGISLAAGIQW